MADKVQLIKKEILRRKQSWQHPDKQYEHGGKDVCDYLLGFIDSLPEEHNEDLEEYYTKEFLPKEWFANPGHRTISQFNFFTAQHFTEWQKQKDLQDFLEKAEEFLYLQLNNGSIECGNIEKLIEQFKNYMKNEM